MAIPWASDYRPIGAFYYAQEFYYDKDIYKRAQVLDFGIFYLEFIWVLWFEFWNLKKGLLRDPGWGVVKIV